jgi:uncharacterized protein YraI
MSVKQILLAALLAVFPIISSATDYYIATSELNIRTGAGTEYSVSFTLQKGDEVELLSRENNWYKIKYLGKTGYGFSKFLKFVRTTSDAETFRYQQIANNLLVGVCVLLFLLLAFIIYRKIRNKNLLESVTDKKRGTKSERDLVLKLLNYGIPGQNIFHDLYVGKVKDEFSQADLVIVTEVGIIVFEVKDYSGWIFGRGNQSQWTKVLAYGKQKYRFYNPIMQNNKHITELRKHLIQFGKIPFYSIVVFYGDCVLKEIDFVPNGTFIVKSERTLEVVKIILRDNQPFHYTNKVELFRVLREAVINGGIIENQIQHKENIKDMLGKHRVFD